MKPILEVENLSVRYTVGGGLLNGPAKVVRAVEEVSFSIMPGETIGLVGESGCGKTSLGRAIVGLQRASSGVIRFAGETLDFGSNRQRVTSGLQMIFQNPYASLNPRMTVEQIVGEALQIHRLAGGAAERREAVVRLLVSVGLDAQHMQRYPHEFSGGQRQRIGIARALAVKPKLLVCDEPVSALDVSVQAQIVNLLRDLQQTEGLAYLFIAHDLGVVRHISHRVLVMYLGRVVETGSSDQVCLRPRHPYTKALISAVPSLLPTNKSRVVLQGELPSPLNPPTGCPFHPRCPIAEARCRTELPLPREIGASHLVACHLADQT